MSDRNFSGSIGCDTHVRIGQGANAIRLSATGGNTLLVDDVQILNSANPSLPNTLAPGDIREAQSVSVLAANSAYGYRLVVPRNCTIADLAVWVQVQSGNIDVGIYNATVTPRAKLYSAGSTACPAAGAWEVIASPNLVVTAGQAIDLVFAADNATASFGRWVMNGSNAARLPSAAWIDALAPDAFTAWQATTAFPLGTTITPSASGVTVPAVIGRLV